MLTSKIACVAFAIGSITQLASCARDNNTGGRSDDLPFERIDDGQNRGSASLTAGSLTSKSIVIDLATSPNPSVSWNTTACRDALPADFAIGEAVCEAKPELTTPILAGHAQQLCSDEPDAASIEASLALELEGCDSVQLNIFSFSPNLTITVQ